MNFLFLALPYDHIKTKTKKSSYGLNEKMDCLMKIVSGSIFMIFFHASACPYAVFKLYRSMFVINWLSNLDSFPCHHPTIAGAAAKQLIS